MAEAVYLFGQTEGEESQRERAVRRILVDWDKSGKRTGFARDFAPAVRRYFPV